MSIFVKITEKGCESKMSLRKSCGTIVELLMALLGIGVIGASIGGGLWMGVWWALIGGIIQIIEAAKCDPIQSSDIAFGVARLIFASAIGWGITIFGSIFGWFLIRLGCRD